MKFCRYFKLLKMNQKCNFKEQVKFFLNASISTDFKNIFDQLKNIFNPSKGIFVQALTRLTPEILGPKLKKHQIRMKPEKSLLFCQAQD